MCHLLEKKETVISGDVILLSKIRKCKKYRIIEPGTDVLESNFINSTISFLKSVCISLLLTEVYHFTIES